MVSYGYMGRKKISFDVKPTDRIKHLIYDRPEWGPILRACLEVWKESKTPIIAGSWVYKKVKAKGLKPPSNLRLGVRYGILKPVGRSRAGKRVYYAMSNPAALDRTLRELFPSKKKRGISLNRRS